MLDEASAALTHLDANVLEEIGRRARLLVANGTVPTQSSNDKSTLLQTRLTGFTDALRATGATLDVLGRATTAEPSERTSYGFFESLGLYSEDLRIGDQQRNGIGSGNDISGGRSWAP